MFESIFGLEMPLAFRFFIVALIFLAVLGLVGWLVRRSGGQANAPPIPFAKIIAEKNTELSVLVGFSVLMLIIFSLVALNEYMTATTVLQQTVALLILIGNNTFWGIFIIAGNISRKQTHIVYSDIAVNLEKNIARLEKLQEQASSVSAVADAISPAHAGSDTVDKAHNGR
jgi:hypothetical protein